MSEVQRHGFDFENWVKETLFADFQLNYIQKWDVAVKANYLKKIQSYWMIMNDLEKKFLILSFQPKNL